MHTLYPVNLQPDQSELSRRAAERYAVLPPSRNSAR